MQPAESKALTPLKLFSQQDPKNIPVFMTNDLDGPTDLDSVRSSLTEYVPREILSRRDSGVSLCSSANAIMDNLTGVSL